MSENTTNPPCMITLRFDQQTYDFLQALRDQDGVNISAWIRDAVRKKAGLSGDPMTLGARPRKAG